MYVLYIIIKYETGINTSTFRIMFGLLKLVRFYFHNQLSNMYRVLKWEVMIGDTYQIYQPGTCLENVLDLRHQSIYLMEGEN